MSYPVIALMLLAASLSAAWNAVIKGADNKLYMTTLLTGGCGLVGALALPFVHPAPASWPFIAVSGALSVLYYIIVAKAYRVGDLSLVYPVMRGTVPLLVAVTGRVVLGERLSAAAWLGVGLISFGILCLAGGAMGRRVKGLGFALGNAGVIALYTLIDGLGVRRSGSPVGYAMAIFLLTAVPLVGWAVATGRAGFVRYAMGRWWLAALGGIVGVATYSTTLWAMTLAPVAVVAALRETSTLFAVAISALVLRERVGWSRLAVVCAIAGGAMVLRLA